MGKILTELQKEFVKHFSQTGNATQSAVKAGYSKKSAEQQGYELKNKLSLEIENFLECISGWSEISYLNGFLIIPLFFFLRFLF